MRVPGRRTRRSSEECFGRTELDKLWLSITVWTTARTACARILARRPPVEQRERSRRTSNADRPHDGCERPAISVDPGGHRL